MRTHSLALQLADFAYAIRTAECVGLDSTPLRERAAELIDEFGRSQRQEPKPVIHGDPVELRPGEQTITVEEFLRRKGKYWVSRAAPVGVKAASKWKRLNPGKEMYRDMDGIYAHNAYAEDSLPILEQAFTEVIQKEGVEIKPRPRQEPVYFETEEWMTAEGWLTRKGLYTHARVKAVTRHAEALAKKRCEWPLRVNELDYYIYSQKQLYLLELSLARVTAAEEVSRKRKERVE